MINTPTTASGSLDRRFKSTREIERKEREIERKAFGVTILISLLVFFIGSFVSRVKNKTTNKDTYDSVVVEKGKTRKEKKSPSKNSSIIDISEDMTIKIDSLIVEKNDTEYSDTIVGISLDNALIISGNDSFF